MKKRKRQDAQPKGMSQGAAKLNVALVGLPLEPSPADAALLRAAAAQVSQRLYVLLLGDWASVPAPVLERRIVAVLDLASEQHASIDVRPLLQGVAAAHGALDIEAVLGAPLAENPVGDHVLNQINAARRAWAPQSLPALPYRAVDPDSPAVRDAAGLGPPAAPSHDAADAASPFPTFTDACVGGTFDRLHNGHKVLLLVSALCTSKRLVVGVTGDPLLRKKALRELLEPLSFRIAVVENFLRAVKPDIEYEVVGIDDPYGPAITDAALRAIVVSSETRGGGNACNVKRRESTTPMNDLAVVEIGLVADADAGIDADTDAKLSSSGERARELAHVRPAIDLEAGHERGNGGAGADGGGNEAACEGRSAPSDPWHWIRRTPAGQPYCIGLTGGIASGKSTCAAFLRDELGARMIDCDKLGHRAYVKGTDAFEQIKKAFGEGVVGADGEIDRTKLGPIVFGDPAQMQRLNGIVWPAIAALADEERARLGAEGVKVCVMEAAIMLEAGWATTVDEVWLVFAPRDTCIERLRARNGLTQQQAEMRMDAQMDNDQRVAHESVNVLVSSAGDLSSVQRQLRAHWQGATQRASQHVGIVQSPSSASRLRTRWFELLKSPALLHKGDGGGTGADPTDACGSFARRWWRRLCEMYGGRMRFYHTLHHLHEMFRHFDSHVTQLRRPELVALAIFFHDAVYDARRRDNESKSAVLLREFCVDAEACGAGAVLGADIETASDWIERTASHHTADSATVGDLAFFLDFDLAVLGASHAQYARYAECIRLEYHHVPWRDFKQGRSAVLARFAEVQQLFFTDSFRAAREAAARTNIACELEHLRVVRGAESRSQL